MSYGPIFGIFASQYTLFFFLFADRMSITTLAETGEVFSQEKVKRFGSSNPRTRIDGLNSKGTKRHFEGDIPSEPGASIVQI